MKRLPLLILAAVLALSPGVNRTALADDYPAEYNDSWAQPDELFTAEELDDLLAPIALYPDPLLAQILPAATFVDQIDEAARYVGQYGPAARIDDQPWDISVRAVAHYPKILFMMDQKYDWCVSLGQAYVNQPQDVLDAIQRLRAEARAQGNLVTTPQQAVIIEDAYIRIIPAEPRVIYVPTYDPFLVYAEPLPSYGFISFGIGFTIGAWLNRDCDWHKRRIYYHGWRGGGWIDRSRRYVHTRRSVYINNNYTVVNINRRVVQHDTVRFRENIRRNVEHRREHRPPETRGHDRRPGTSERRVSQPPAGSSTPSSRSAPTVGQPRQQPQRRTTVTPAPQRQPAGSSPTPPRTTTGTTPTPPRVTGTTSSPPQASPGVQAKPRSGRTGFSRGREQRGTQLPANTGFGVYGSSGETKTYRERGENSRENMQRLNRQPSAAPPVSRPAPSFGRQPAPATSAPRQSAPANRGGGNQRERR